MGRKVKDLTGMKFGRLIVIERCGSDKHKNALWLCKCECGNEIVIRGSHLISGNTTSCGCYQKEKMKEQWQNEEFRKIQSEKTKEKWQNEEFKQMKSYKMKEQWQDKEFRQMQSEKMKELNKEMWKDEERRQMKTDEMRELSKEMWQNEEFRQMQSEKSSKRMKEMWKDEEMKWKLNYKGGITPISIYLRNLNEQWCNNCKQQVKYTCELTGKVGYKLNTHHLKAFNTIVLEAHELHNVEIHEIVGDYTEEELYKLEEYVASWHKDNSNAVVLCDEVHTLFHSLYGYGNNTKEQFEEFKKRYLNGEFKDLLGDDFND